MRKTGLGIAFGASTALLMAGCTSSGPAQPGTADAIRASLNEGVQVAAQAPARPPREVSEALLPPITIGNGGSGRLLEPRFDVKVRDARADEFFLGLVEGTPYDVVVHPAVGGTISLDLKNVTVPEVMETLRTAFGYEYERRGSVFQVLPEALRSRVFHVNYLDLRRDGQSSMSASPGQVSQSRQGSSTARTSAASANATGATGAGASGSYSRINTSSSSDFWTSLTASLQQLLGEGEGRAVTVNPQAGVVVVRGMPRELREVEAFLQATEAVVQRQVILEARIIEVELSDAFQSGINWAAIGRNNGDTAVGGQFGSASLLDSGQSSLAGRSNVLNPNNLPDVRGDVANAFGGMFAMAVDLDNFTGFIELLKTQGNVQVLSSPRVSTMNNQKAVIRVGSDEFFVTDVNTNTTVGAATSQDLSVELTPFFSGVSLDVTPQISPGGEVILHVHPTVSQVSEQVKNVIASGTLLTIPLAASTIRESDSVIRARDSQIVVIGGLMETTTREEQARVPLLGDIPLLGALFHHTRQVKRKSELVILLKPMVVATGEQWAEQLRGSTRRFEALGVPGDGQ